MDLIEVDIVSLETAETGFDGIHDVSAGGAYVVAAGAHAAEDLGGENDVLAGDVQVLEGLAECLFAFAFRVDIGRVKEIDAGIDGGFNEFVGSRLVDRSRWSSKSRRHRAKVMVPRQRVDTSRPVLPRVLYSIVSLS